MLHFTIKEGDTPSFGTKYLEVFRHINCDIFSQITCYHFQAMAYVVYMLNIKKYAAPNGGGTLIIFTSNRIVVVRGKR